MKEINQPPANVIMLHETVMQCLARDAVTFGCLLGTVAVGVWVDSAALQWIGGLMWVVWVLARASQNRNRMTPQQAANWLAEKYGVSA